MAWRRNALSGAGAAMVVLLAACGAPEQSTVDFLVPVVVKEVGKGDVEDRIVVTGVLRAPEVATLSAETNGTLEIARVGGLLLREGDHVAAGQVLATITGEEVPVAARTEANLRRYEAAERDYEGKKRLFEEGLIPGQEVKLAEATLAEAKVNLEGSQLTEKRTRITSPIDGVVLRLARDQQGELTATGQRVTTGFVVAQVAPTSRLFAEVDLLGPDAVRVRDGLPARIRPLSASTQVFSGKVVRIAPQMDATTRTLRAQVQLDNPGGQLKPGMFVEATVVAERRENVVVAPRSAVTERNGAPVVFVLKGQQVARRDVTLGLGDDEIVEVRSGLASGDRVVVQGLETLADGARVRVTGG